MQLVFANIGDRSRLVNGNANYRRILRLFFRSLQIAMGLAFDVVYDVKLYEFVINRSANRYKFF